MKPSAKFNHGSESTLDPPTLRKAKLGKSAGKVMASVFWDSDGILMIDYLAKGKTINGIHYADLIEKLRIAI